jgi:RNA polymerase sigma factor (sigma-70 family)
MNPVPRQQPDQGAELAAIGEVLRGNVDAFQLIVERYRAQIFRLCLSYLGAREDAEEAAQEIFFRAFRSLHRFSLDKRFLPWLYSIAINHLRSSYTRRQRRPVLRSDDGASVADPHRSDPQQLALEAWSRRRVREAVAALPTALRGPVLLYYFEELSVEAIASILELGEENVKSRLWRARHRLRKILAEDATPAPPPAYTNEADHGGV